MQLDLFEWLQEQEALDLSVQKEIEQEERLEWNEGDIELLHLYLLEDSLVKLKNSRSKKTVAEILQWVTRPLVDMPTSFSFQACCIYEGVNPWTFQEMLLREVQYAKN